MTVHLIGKLGTLSDHDGDTFAYNTATCIFISFIPIMFYLFAGIGSAMAYAPSIVTTTQYFDKRKALANGIAVAGGGIGNFIAPPLIQQLLEWYDLSGSFLILAALMLHICLSGALFRPFVYSTLPKKQAEAPPKSDSLLTPANHEKVLNQYDADTCETLCHLGEKADSVHLLPKPPDCQSELKSDTMPHKTGQPKSDIVLEPDKSKSDTVQAADKPKSGTELYLDEGYGTSTEKSDITVPSESQESPGTTPTTHIPAGNGYVTDQNVDIERPRCCTSAWCNSCCAVTTPHGGKRPVFEWQLLKNSVFLIYGFSMFFAFSGYPNVFMIIVSHAMQMDIDRSRATFLVSIIGIFDVVGRIGFGWFSDLNLIRKKHGFMITMAIAGLACMLMPVVGHSYVGLSILCAIFGLFAGSFYALLPAILVEGLGEKKLLSAFGLVTLFMGTAFIYATFVVGKSLYNVYIMSKHLIISPNELVGDIMVLASPPRPPVDPDDVNALTRKIFDGSLSNFMRVDTPLRYVAILILSKH